MTAIAIPNLALKRLLIRDRRAFFSSSAPLVGHPQTASAILVMCASLRS